MAKDPAFLFYTADFLTGTMFMTNEQIGIYIKLLCAQHQHGGLLDKASFNALVGDHAVVRAKFEETDDGFFNVRLMDEMDKRAIKSTNLSKSAKVRWSKHNKCNANAMQKDMPTEDEDVNSKSFRFTDEDNDQYKQKPSINIKHTINKDNVKPYKPFKKDSSEFSYTPQPPGARVPNEKQTDDYIKKMLKEK